MMHHARVAAPVALPLIAGAALEIGGYENRIIALLLLAFAVVYAAAVYVPWWRVLHGKPKGRIEFESDGLWWRYVRTGSLGIPIVRAFCNKHGVDYVWRSHSSQTHQPGQLDIISAKPGQLAGSLWCAHGSGHADYFKRDPLGFGDAERAAVAVARAKVPKA